MGDPLLQQRRGPQRNAQELAESQQPLRDGFRNRETSDALADEAAVEVARPLTFAVLIILAGIPLYLIFSRRQVS